MLLTADIGNTSISLGVFDGEALVEKFRLASDKDLSQQEYEVLLKTLCKPFAINGCIIASVVDELSKKFQLAVDNVFNIKALMLTCECETGVKISLENPKEAGADRIANACGAFMLYEKPCIVVDFGTATSFDIINKNGEFIGGVITPGLNLQMKVLNKFTSKLPKIDVAISTKAIGNNTSEAILSGVIRGTACLIEGLVEQCEAELGGGNDLTNASGCSPNCEKVKAVLIATGGYSGLISSYLKRPFDFINPTLTLEGLRFLYDLNTKQ